MSFYPPALTNLIRSLQKLPGVGQRTAERFAFQMINWSVEEQKDLSETLQSLSSDIQYCDTCHCFLHEENACHFCGPSRMMTKQLCILAFAKEVYAFEQTGTFRGSYHVLNGLLSPLDGIDPSSLHFESLLRRIEEEGIKEIIIALDSTLEGDATTLYLKKILEGKNLQLTRIAFGLPMGSSLDYADETTLSRALSARQSL